MKAKAGLRLALAGAMLSTGILAPATEPTTSSRTVLGIRGTQFTVNGKPTFLLGISYYGALGAPQDAIVRDLGDMQRLGFNWIRVWATWAAFENDVSAVDGRGDARGPFLEKLRWLIEECDRRGMIVDVTLSRGNGVTGAERLGTLEALGRAVETLVQALRPYRNWYLDMGNERNIRDGRFVAFEELIDLRKRVRQLDPTRLATASSGSDIDKDDLRRHLIDVGVDFIAPHRPRNPKSPDQTDDQTKRYLAWMNELGKTVPVHYQEPFRKGFQPKQWEPRAEDFLSDLRNALAGDAAGWCFHNGDQKDRPGSKPRRSFDMREARLFDQLDEEEMKFLGEMKKVVLDKTK